MKSHSFILVFALLLGTACDGASSGGEDGPNATGGVPSGGASGGVPSNASGGNPSVPSGGGTVSGGSGGESGSENSGSGGATWTDGGAGGAPSPDENDPSCPAELPEHEGTCFVYPNIVCSYEDAPALGGHCICVALKWDCTGCPAEPIHGEMDCSGYEGETCGGCSCSQASPNWDCGIEF